MIKFRRVPRSLLLFALANASGSAQPCRIEVVERGSGWAVPLVELRTTHGLRFVSDNAGVIAMDAPELLGRETWFGVHGHGYEVPKDGFGYRGVRLTPQAGATLRVEVTRTNIARRLGRLTGAGIFAESQQLGYERGWREGGIAGCDSVQNVVHRGRLFWAWGDTTFARYPLGIFDATGATTPIAFLASAEPPVRVVFDYFRNERAEPRAIARMPGKGPTWLTGCASLPDQRGNPRLVASYMKVEPPLDVYQWGLCVWNEDAKAFEPLRVVWTKSPNTPKPPPIPQGHATAWMDERGKPWILFGNPLPNLRCPASFEAWQDSASWESLTPQENLAVADGKPVKPHSGSIAWHPWRRRWVTVFLQWFGQPSAFGELWYAEAERPTGPWGTAVKVLSHDNYTFYNPRVHAELATPDSPVLIFEGTYTAMFANKPEPTLRHDYNQVLYRLDLDDPALAAQPR